MYTWRSSIIAAATLMAGCASTIEEGPPSPGASNGGSAGTAAGAGSPGAVNPGTAGSTNAGTSGVPGTPGAPGGSGAAGSAGVVPPPPPGTPVTINSNCTPGVPATSQIPRLTNEQYDRTVRDLLGVTALKASNNAAPSNLLATDQGGGLSDLGWSGYKSVADMIATQVMADPALKTKFLQCTPTGDGKACLHDTIVKFGRRAFRRPLSAEEVAAFDAIVAKGKEITPSGAPEEVAKALLYMFLISPSFLMRAEIQEQSDGAGHFNLSPHEVASRLSYMLWGSAPDDMLSQAADQGQLTTPEQVRAQAQRMVMDPRARDMVAAFHRYYLLMLGNTRWDNTNKDPSLFPAFKKEQVPAMATEIEMLFDKVVFGNGQFKDLFLTPVAFVNAATAPLYGKNPADYGSELKETLLDPAQRPGFLTRAGFLAAYSDYTRTSPILRGAFISKQVLGVDIPPPPPGAGDTPLPDDASLDTNRKKVDAQTAGDTCKGCHHKFINPPGFVMEAYDSIGAYRTQETSGAAIDTAADVTINGVVEHVANPAELMAKIAASPEAQIRYAQRWVSYAYQREGHPNDGCTVQQLAAKLTNSGYTVLNLVTDLSQTLSFRVRAVETP